MFGKREEITCKVMFTIKPFFISRANTSTCMKFVFFDFKDFQKCLKCESS